MALISTQTLTLKSPPTLSHPSVLPTPQSLSLSPPNHHSLSLSTPNSTPRFSARRHVVSRATATSASDFSPDIGEILGDVSIYTAAGDSVQFRDLWDPNEGVAVVALLRHFGCPCCWELASALKESKERFDSAGVKLIAVGVGSPDKARILAERLPFPMDSLYADTDRKAYDVLGLYYGLGRTFFNPASAKVLSRFDALKKAVKNYTIEATPDDRSSVLQQGGMFVFKGAANQKQGKVKGKGNIQKRRVDSVSHLLLQELHLQSDLNVLTRTWKLKIFFPISNRCFNEPTIITDVTLNRNMSCSRLRQLPWLIN